MAENVKVFLEKQNISCWKAPEDIPMGSNWDTAIVEGLNACQVVVLLFSKDADDSIYVKKEMNMAFHFELPVIPFRIEDAEPWKLLVYLAGVQQLDAVNDLSNSLEKLASHLKQVITSKDESQEVHNDTVNSIMSSKLTIPGVKVDVTGQDKKRVLSTLPEYGEWATHQELRTKLNWDMEYLTRVLKTLKSEEQIFYRGNNGGNITLRSEALTELNRRLKSGEEKYPFFVNVGDSSINDKIGRCWEDYKRNNCFGAGGGSKFRDAMKSIPINSEVYLYQSGFGYVGQAKTISNAIPMKEFLINGKPIINQPLKGDMSNLNDNEKCEWLIAIDQFKSLPAASAVRKKGLFVYIATSCRMMDVVSIQYLRNVFTCIESKK